MALNSWEAEMLHERVALDFVNTVSNRKTAHPIERIGDAPALFRWAVLAGVLSREKAAALQRRADGKVGDQLAREGVRLRDALYRIFRATGEGQGARSEDLQVLNDMLAQAASQRRLEPGGDGCCRWAWSDAESEPAYVLWRAAQDAADLLTSSAALRVHSCPGCDWLFLDTSKNGRRRWCDMSACGNRAKARRHYARVSAASSDASGR